MRKHLKTGVPTWLPVVLTNVVCLLIGLIAVTAVSKLSRIRTTVDVKAAAEANGSGETTCTPGCFSLIFRGAWKLCKTTTADSLF